MADISLMIEGDLDVSATGDLLTVDGLDMTTQRIIRRLMTCPGDYVWHPDYGAGLPREIGGNVDVGRIKSLITSQIYAEGTVAANPPPEITVEPILHGVNVRIVYWSRITGQQQTLSFDVSR